MLQILVSAVEVAQAKGAFNLDDAAVIAAAKQAAVKELQELAPKEEPTEVAQMEVVEPETVE